MKICIVIPTYNRKDYLRNLLYQIKEQKIESHEIQTIIAVDGSTDGTLEMLKDEFPEVHIVKGTGDWWYTKSMNEGFKYAGKLKPDYALALNDDIEVSDDYINQLLDGVNKVKKNSIIGSVSFTYEKPHKIFTAGVKNINPCLKSIHYYRPFTVVETEMLSGIHPTKVLPGRGMLIPFNILKKLDFFDETFIQYRSDYDFCLRAAKAGYSLYISWDAQIYSYEKKTSISSSFIRKSLLKFIGGFCNPYSRIYFPAFLKYSWRHYRKILWPIYFVIFILASFKANYVNTKL
jgi:GT2 family glycosyltransferase